LHEETFDVRHASCSTRRTIAHRCTIQERIPVVEVTVPMRALRSILLLLFATSAGAHDSAVAHRVHTAGVGRPVVIFENGLGDTLEVWNAVQPTIAAACGLTLTYNRAGYLGSGAAPGPRDAASIIAELRKELKRRNLSPPYVLVGHSLGGLYMQYFARQFSREVAGLVLVDSTHWNQQLLLGAPNEQSTARRGRVVLFMDFIAQRELADSALAGEQVNASPIPNFVPTVVLSSTGVFRGETPAARAQAARLQEDIVASFGGARHIRVDGSGHYIQKDRPDAVISAVREIAGCRARDG
jgi:pimeloyl-ACP methyl ester carboxylesterase